MSERQAAYGMGIVLLPVLALTTVVFWLPFVRALIEPSTYEWGLLGFGGRGITADFWIPTIGLGLALALRWFGWRGSGRQRRLAVLAWFGFLAAVALYQSLAHPDSFVLRGDTVGLEVSLAWLAPALATALLGAAIVWSRGLEDAAPGADINLRNWCALGLAALMTIASVFLLSSGDHQSGRDQAGVRLLFLAWLVLEGFYAPARRRGHVPGRGGRVATAAIVVAIAVVAPTTPAPAGVVALAQQQPIELPEGPFQIVNLLWLRPGNGAEGLAAYLDEASPLLRQHGGEVANDLALAAPLSGDDPPDRVIIVRWPDRDRFVAFLSDPGYQQMRERLRAAVERVQVFATTPF